MKLRKRIKKAVFAFFKEEILKCYDSPFAPILAITHSRELEFHEIKNEIRLQPNRNNEMYVNEYELALEECKHKLFKEIVQYMAVDERSVLEDQFHQERRIAVSIFVGKRKY